MGHRYWRVLGGPSLDCAELVMRTTSGGAQACSGGTIISSGETGGYEASKVFDGNVATYFSPSTAASHYQCFWIGYDFGAGNAPDIVEVAYTSAASYRPTWVAVQASDDGLGYFDVWVATGLSWGSGNDTKTWTLNPATDLRQYHDDAHRYWRLWAPNNYYTSIGEMELKATPAGSDVTAGGAAGTASADTAYSGSWGASKAFDDNTGTGWESQNSTPPHWLKMDFGAAPAAPIVGPQAIQAYSVRVSGYTSECPITFGLQWSDDDSVWYFADVRWGVSAWGSGETRSYTVESPLGFTPTPPGGSAARPQVACIT